MTGRPATINDVAAAAGVSRQTVTRAVNDMPGISTETRARVLAAARELRYRPSRFGRGLVKPQTSTLGLLIEDLSNPYYAELASAVLGLAADAGWNVIFGERAHAAHAEEFLIDDFSRQVDAVISFTGIAVATSRDGLPDLPLVEIDPLTSSAGHGRVELLRKEAVADAVRHLAERGTKHPVVFDHPDPSPRAAEFIQAFAAQGVPAARIPSVGSGLEGGLLTAQAVLREKPDTDAIVAYNDVMGFGVLRALALAGVDVPGRIRVIGVDGLEIGHFITPRLTTLAIDMHVVAQTALDLLLRMHTGDLPTGGRPTRRTVPYRFEIGEST
ncbi:DNA-binding LacI/PurR family transcriptional regulator [Nakamurella sp. UYEF19]|uniref:LacI family DNA-binding transcriptional regulator n=1 Tax=Nakamurella sp. UYEF19 TaxID=1756392 RepID=UPI0033957707